MRTVLAACAAAVFAVGAHADSSVEIAGGGTLASHGGRYVFGQISQYARATFMLDTQTGRLWRLVCVNLKEDSKECLQNALEPMPYLNNNGELAGTLPPGGQPR